MTQGDPSGLLDEHGRCPCNTLNGCDNPGCDKVDRPFAARISGPSATQMAARAFMAPPYTVKDSGKREEFSSGMVRDTTEDKIDYSLALDGPMFKRYAAHLTKGATKYSPRNWMKANGSEELDRFRASAFRHFLQWYDGETDEDHAAAVIFNINGAEYVKDRLQTHSGG